MPQRVTPIKQEASVQAIQFSGQEWGGLNVNWAAGGSARFYGCYTSNFAQDFANAQGKTSYGFHQYAYFSSDPNHRVGPNPTGPLYLSPGQGFMNGNWATFGTSRKMDPTMDKKDPVATPK